MGTLLGTLWLRLGTCGYDQRGSDGHSLRRKTPRPRTNNQAVVRARYPRNPYLNAKGCRWEEASSLRMLFERLPNMFNSNALCLLTNLNGLLSLEICHQNKLGLGSNHVDIVLPAITKMCNRPLVGRNALRASCCLSST